MPLETDEREDTGHILPQLASPWKSRDAGRPFFENAEIRALQDRARSYVLAGVPVHFSGAAGMGKTTLALRIAEQIGRHVSFMTGDHMLTRRDLIGREVGQTTYRVDDKYIASVRRTETRVRVDW